MSRNSAFWRYALWILITGSVGQRFCLPLFANPLSFIFMSAPQVQWQNATMPLDPNPLAVIDPFFYQAWLGLIAKITMGTPLAIGIYAGLLSAITPWPWYRFLREALPSKMAAQAGWVLLGWLPSWIGLFSYFIPETLLLPLMGFSLWMTWRSLRKGSFESFVWAALLWTACCLTKMTVLPVAGLCLGWLLWRQSPRVKRIALVIGVALACAIPLGYRSYTVLGVWAPFGYPVHNRIYMVSGAATLNLQIYRDTIFLKNYRFTSASTQVAPFEPLSDWRSSRQGVCTVQIHLENGTQDWNAAYAANKGSWRRRLRLQLENAVFTLWGPSWPDKDMRRFSERLSYLNRWLWAPLLIFVLFFYYRKLQKDRQLDLLPLISLVGWFFILIQPVAPAEGRYRKPFEGLLLAQALWLVPHRRSKPEA